MTDVSYDYDKISRIFSSELCFYFFPFRQAKLTEITQVLTKADFGTHPYENETQADDPPFTTQQNFLSQRQLAKQMTSEAVAGVAEDAMRIVNANVAVDDVTTRYRDDIYSVDRTRIVRKVLKQRKNSERKQGKHVTEQTSGDVTTEDRRIEEKKMLRNLLRKEDREEEREM